MSGPRSCTWATGADPAQAVVQLGLASQRWLRSPREDEGIGTPCEQGSAVTTVLGRRAGLHATCLVHGVAVFLTATTAERAELIDLLDLAVSRIGSIDRAAFGFGSTTETTASQTPGAPPECVEVWRAGQFALFTARTTPRPTAPPWRTRSLSRPRP